MWAYNNRTIIRFFKQFCLDHLDLTENCKYAAYKLIKKVLLLDSDMKKYDLYVGSCGI